MRQLAAGFLQRRTWVRPLRGQIGKQIDEQIDDRLTRQNDESD